MKKVTSSDNPNPNPKRYNPQPHIHNTPPLLAIKQHLVTLLKSYNVPVTTLEEAFAANSETAILN